MLTHLRKRISRVLFRLAPVLVLSATLPACALLTGDDPEEEEDGVNGMWERVDGYIHITNSTITFYQEGFEGDCYIIDEFEIQDVDGDVYEVEWMGLEFEMELRRDGDELEMEIDGEVVEFEESNVDPDDLDECDPIVFDPQLGTCTSHTQLPVPGSVSGSLTSGDLSSSGLFYDRYRVNLATTSDLDISQTSSEIDSYLYLFAADGTFIAESDDEVAGNGDSRILESGLPAGCYIVIASSYFQGETGTYSLTATTF